MKIVHEDKWLYVIDKPPGQLSQPGKTVDGSVQTLAGLLDPSYSGPKLVHRLDMDTSGLMVLARRRDVHYDLHTQFSERKVYKRYVAETEAPIDAAAGIIDLPLRLQIEARPRQCVCFRHGKRAITLWRQIGASKQRLELHPLTGRTHQLRLHLADPLGLGNPIAGDRLYGQGEGSAERMKLHAAALGFRHPGSGRRLVFESTVPF